MIKLKGLTQTFERQIFKSANFTIKKNEIVGLVGKSGTGKSTLLKVLSGRLQPDEGSMFWMGEKMPEPKELLIPPIRFRIAKAVFESIVIFITRTALLAV